MTNFANHYSHTDIEPYEVVRIVSDKTIEIREMDAQRDESIELKFYVGGFSAHCSNQRDQRWNIASNPQNPVTRIRLTKQGWKDAYGRKFRLSNEPVKFYDYNF